MQITLKRLAGLAAIYGIIRYVRAAGGPEHAFASLKEKAQGFIDSTLESSSAAKRGSDTGFATNVAKGPRKSVADDQLH